MTITWKHFPAGEHGFFRAPVLLEGQRDAILIDGGFTLEDGRKVAAAVAATHKRLTTVYVTQGDPDYYFSLGPIRLAFPDARVIAAESTVAAITANVEKKLAVWGPKLGDNGPQSLADVVIPTASNEARLVLEDAEIEIADRYLWVPSLRAVFGGVLVFSGVHVWTADTGAQARKGWIEALDALAARKPAVVVPGHASVDAALDATAIAYTREYLVAFEQELAKARDSADLIAAMKKRYPNAGMEIALELGAKVAKKEIQWG